jgi:hypothetical protein
MTEFDKRIRDALYEYSERLSKDGFEIDYSIYPRSVEGSKRIQISYGYNSIDMFVSDKLENTTFLDSFISNTFLEKVFELLNPDIVECSEVEYHVNRASFIQKYMHYNEGTL